jgi:DMSO/TMAO reductase YedYZ molybdopterin-dependent catalytic subunit
MATLRETAREILAEGADGGHVVDAGGNIRYARSLPPQRAMHPDTLLAYAMNGEPLPPEHGFPLRLVVPGWYGMASVKWITRIAAIPHPFDGFYQVDRYVLVDRTTGDKTPLKEMRVRALITSPRQGSRVPLGLQRIRGLAWSGSAPIEGVDVSTDGGETWRAAEMLGREEPYAWRRWEFSWEGTHPGPVTLLCRARDAAGNQQPNRSEWNILGYCANAVQRVDLTIV